MNHAQKPAATRPAPNSPAEGAKATPGVGRAGRKAQPTPENSPKMFNEKSSVIRDEFATKYDYQHARGYHAKHRRGLVRRLSDWREKEMAAKALAAIGQPRTVLDLPCGTGRFWPLLGAAPERTIIAADSSPGMLRVALENRPPELAGRLEALHTSAYAIALPDDAVDMVFCMRLLHHIGEPEKRLEMLREFHRVSRRWLLLSLWVDGNFKAWRRCRRDAAEAVQGLRRPANRFLVSRREIAREFSRSGFQIVGHYDFLPLYSMWRLYVLEKKTPAAVSWSLGR
jgi:SAM-dependent methyltransferase